MTDRQRSYIRSLCEQWGVRIIESEIRDSKQASEVISLLLKSDSREETGDDRKDRPSSNSETALPVSDVAQTDRAAAIAKLNDRFRTTLARGRVLMTDGVNGLGQAFVSVALDAERGYRDFTVDNDPYHEHNFGKLTIGEHQLLLEDRLLRSI